VKPWIDFFVRARTHPHYNIIWSCVKKKKITFIKSVFPFSLNSRFYLLVFLTLYRPIKIFSLFPGVDSYVKNKKKIELFICSIIPHTRGIVLEYSRTRASPGYGLKGLHTNEYEWLALGKCTNPYDPDKKQKKKRFGIQMSSRGRMSDDTFENSTFHCRNNRTTYIYENQLLRQCFYVYYNIVIITISFVICIRKKEN